MPGPAPVPAVVAAEAELARREPVLAELVSRRGPCSLGAGRRRGSHFESLAAAVVHQQLAGRAAGAIWRRVREQVGLPFNPEGVLALGPEPLRAAGLSGAKAAALADLAARVADGRLPLAGVSRRCDADIVAALSEVRGVGRWTAEMFLIFGLGRLDVWPTGDLGVRKGYAVAFGLRAPPPPEALEALGRPYRPWRSVVAWYCWRAVETVTPPL
ncbi:MAG: DNA-3-methyladenine glycosylase family protein [Acidimicrobiales bacterium]